MSGDLNPEMKVTVSVTFTPHADPLREWEADLLDDRRGNEFEKDNAKRCREPHPFSTFVCFAALGHKGEHVAYTASGDLGGEPDRRWVHSGERPDNGYEPVYHQRCMAKGNKRPGGYKYTCYARRGHTGDHIGYHGKSGEYDDDARWPKE